MLGRDGAARSVSISRMASHWTAESELYFRVERIAQPIRRTRRPQEQRQPAGSETRIAAEASSSDMQLTMRSTSARSASMPSVKLTWLVGWSALWKPSSIESSLRHEERLPLWTKSVISIVHRLSLDDAHSTVMPAEGVHSGGSSAEHAVSMTAPNVAARIPTSLTLACTPLRKPRSMRPPAGSQPALLTCFTTSPLADRAQFTANAEAHRL